MSTTAATDPTSMDLTVEAVRSTAPGWQMVYLVTMVGLGALVLGVLAVQNEYGQSNSNNLIGPVVVEPAETEQESGTALSRVGLTRTAGEDELEWRARWSVLFTGSLLSKYNANVVNANDINDDGVVKILGKSSGSVILYNMSNGAFTLELPNVLEFATVLTKNGREITVDPQGWTVTFVCTSSAPTAVATIRTAVSDDVRAGIRGVVGDLDTGATKVVGNGSTPVYSVCNNSTQLEVGAAITFVYDLNSWLIQGTAWGMDSALC